MERLKVETKYVAVVEDKNGRKQEIVCMMPDIDRINKDVVLGCVVYPPLSLGQVKCSLYYNEGNYPEEELRAAGYDIVKSIERVDVYEESEAIFNAQE